MIAHRDDDDFSDLDVTLTRFGTTYPLFNDRVAAEMQEHLKHAAKEVYNKIGEFRYRQVAGF